jgi:sulfoxide reductase heme-binding subunit YedZ
MSKVLHSIPLLYALMLLPAVPVVRGLIEGGWYTPEMLHISGIWAMRLLVLTVVVTPALLLLTRFAKGRPWAQKTGRWLLPRRRHFGLGSFVYVALHLAHYVVESGDLRVVLSEVLRFELLVGWVAFGVFVALAVTSNRRAIRAMGTGWKRLHLWIYPAIGLSFLHWWLYDDLIDQLLVWSAALIAAKALHLGLRRRPTVGPVSVKSV